MAPRRGSLLFGSLALVAACRVSTTEVGWQDEHGSWQDERQRDFLRFSCAAPLRPASPSHVLAHLTCEERLDAPALASGSVPAAAWDAHLDAMWQLADASDFRALELVRLLHAHHGHPAVGDALWRRVEDALADYKYWYTDPTPLREVAGAPVVDRQWYWSENHVLVYRTVEYLAGQWMPDRVFSVSGLRGEEHRRRARAAILRWLDHRARWGFSEWHSDVYYSWGIQPLLALVDHADDPQLVKRASIVLDLLWLDIALHLHRGMFGATHGRSYVKDKVAAGLQDTFDGAKILFDDTELPYADPESRLGVAVAASHGYALPGVIRAIARDDAPMLDRERLGVPLDASPPAAADGPVAPAPHGLDYRDEADLPLWWSMNAFTSWPLLPMSIEVAQRYDLWSGPLADLSLVSRLIDLGQPIDVVMEQLYPLYSAYWQTITGPLLQEAHTTTYRSAHYMLSSVQDYRPGLLGNQVHPWQATLDGEAIVFTQQPAFLPVPAGAPPPSWSWQASDEPGPGYWTGEGSLPRIGQDENVAIILYAPQFAGAPFGLSSLDYRDETHAYVPHAHFDEVVQESAWTFARRGDGYLALYSHVPTAWRSGQPEVYDNRGRPFDLVAAGSAQNAWIIELGDAEAWASFAAFRSAIVDAEVTITPLADQGGDGFDDGFDVDYRSPSRGQLAFGWHRPLTRAGAEVALRVTDRIDNPYVRAALGSGRYAIALDDDRLDLDYSAGRRETTP